MDTYNGERGCVVGTKFALLHITEMKESNVIVGSAILVAKKLVTPRLQNPGMEAIAFEF
jgi:hypothetical protein